MTPEERKSFQDIRRNTQTAMKSALLLFLLPAISSLAQRPDALKRLDPSEVAIYNSVASGQDTFNANDQRVVDIVSGVLALDSYPKGGKGIKEFQKAHELDPTGKIDLLTYLFADHDLNHRPTFASLRSGFPKWAQTVCFIDKQTDSQMVMRDYPENLKESTATDFIVIGPQGHGYDLRTQQYISGSPNGYANWTRNRDMTGSNFISILLGGHHQEDRYMFMTIEWEPQPQFSLVLKAYKSGEPLSRGEGHCESLRKE